MPKERTKGKKEIHKDNLETLSFYWKFVLVGIGVQILHLSLFFLYASSFSFFNYFFLIVGVAVQLGCYYGLQTMATPYLGPSGELLEAGMDLSNTYFSEYAIDFIILTTGIQILSAISNYVWLLWLAGPSYLIYKVWTSFIWPWIKSGPDTQEKDKSKKKQKPKFRKAH